MRSNCGQSSFSTVGALKHLGGGRPLSPEELCKLKEVTLSILRDVVDFCGQHGISLMLGGGSCLGAIRHKGFIPWDDDIDVNMTRESYEKFVDLFSSENSSKYSIQYPGNPSGYELGLARVRLKGTCVRTHDDNVDDDCGAYIEIFIIENTPNNPVIRGLHGFVSLVLGFLLSCRRYAVHYGKYEKLFGKDAEGLDPIKKKARIGKLLPFVSIEALLKAWDEWNSMCRNNNSKFVTIPVGRAHYFGELQPRDVFLPIGEGRFESLSVGLPANPDKYMTALYGPDYMMLPPEDQREVHAYLEVRL